MTTPYVQDDRSQKAAVLIVDDHLGNLQALEVILSDQGWNIAKARSGREALALLLDRDFAVVLLDVRMPDMSGFETAELIRRRRKDKLLPIVFVTALDDSLEQITRGYSVGAVDYIMKPINPEILRSKIRVFVDLYEKNQALERSRNFYLNLLDDFPTLVWKSGKDAQSDYFNRSWLSFVGLTLPEERNDGWARGVHPEDRERCLKLFRDAFRTRSFVETEYRLRREDGEYRWILDHGRPYLDFHGEFAGYIHSCHDITRRRDSEEETRAANKELEAFSYTVSHDLRAPLRTLEGFSHALLEDYSGKPLDDKGQEYAQRIARAARQMDELISDLLAFSRLAREVIDSESIDLGPLVSEIIGQLDLKEGEFRILGSLPRVRGNGRLLHQVFSNLLSNAIKFVSPGVKPQVQVRSEAVPAGVRIWVEDNGIGIGAEYHERIFHVFERLNTKAAYPGTGIGLAIVRRAMQRLGGRSGVESTLNQGSRFWIELPPAVEPSPVVHPEGGLPRKEDPGKASS